jgi:hypothetical protein
MPGPKSIRLAEKGGDSSFPNAGFRLFSQVFPLPPRLFAETKKGAPGKVSPGPFWLRRLLFYPGNKEAGLNGQRTWN